MLMSQGASKSTAKPAGKDIRSFFGGGLSATSSSSTPKASKHFLPTPKARLSIINICWRSNMLARHRKLRRLRAQQRPTRFKLVCGIAQDRSKVTL